MKVRIWMEVPIPPVFISHRQAGWETMAVTTPLYVKALQCQVSNLSYALKQLAEKFEFSTT